MTANEGDAERVMNDDSRWSLAFSSTGARKLPGVPSSRCRYHRDSGLWALHGQFCSPSQAGSFPQSELRDCRSPKRYGKRNRGGRAHGRGT